MVVESIFAQIAMYWSTNSVFLDNAYANALGTIVGGLFLTIVYFIWGERALRLPELNGLWMLETNTDRTKFSGFQGLRIRYKVLLLQDGKKIIGTAEKVWEQINAEDRHYTGPNRSRVKLEGAIEKRYLGRSKVFLHLTHDGELRETSAFLALKCSKWRSQMLLRGRFADTAADSYGAAQCIKVPLRGLVDDYRGLPINWFSRLIEVFTKGLYSDEWSRLQSRISESHHLIGKYLGTYNFTLPVAALVIAEDKRYYSHGGTDPIAIVRAMWSILFRGELQGASTIEQQLVRVLLGDYRKSVRRKFKEIVLAVRLYRLLSKHHIPVFYLIHAYYGWKMNGIIQAAGRLKADLKRPSVKEASAIVARIRFPEPSKASRKLADKIQHRENWIAARLVSYPYLVF